MNMPNNDHSVPTPTRNRYSFSLRSLLVFFTVFVVWFGIRVNRASHQEDFVQMIERSGGSIIYDYERNHFAGKRPPPPTMPGPTWLRNLLGEHMLINVEEVSFGKGMPSGELSMQIDAVSKLRPQVKVLYLYDTAVTDEDLRIVSRMPKLVELFLQNTQIGNGGLRHLKGLQNLEGLYIDQSRVDSDGIGHIVGLRNLKRIDAQLTPVGDEAVHHFEQLSNLKVLRLGYSKMSYRSAIGLRESLPDCYIGVEGL